MEEVYWSCRVCGWNGPESEIVITPTGGKECPNCNSNEIYPDEESE